MMGTLTYLLTYWPGAYLFTDLLARLLVACAVHVCIAKMKQPKAHAGRPALYCFCRAGVLGGQQHGVTQIVTSCDADDPACTFQTSPRGFNHGKVTRRSTLIVFVFFPFAYMPSNAVGEQPEHKKRTKYGGARSLRSPAGLVV